MGEHQKTTGANEKIITNISTPSSLLIGFLSVLTLYVLLVFRLQLLMTQVRLLCPKRPEVGKDRFFHKVEILRQGVRVGDIVLGGDFGRNLIPRARRVETSDEHSEITKRRTT